MHFKFSEMGILRKYSEPTTVENSRLGLIKPLAQNLYKFISTLSDIINKFPVVLTLVVAIRSVRVDLHVLRQNQKHVQPQPLSYRLRQNL